jgi:hypothetical protein
VEPHPRPRPVAGLVIGRAATKESCSHAPWATPGRADDPEYGAIATRKTREPKPHVRGLPLFLFKSESVGEALATRPHLEATLGDWRNEGMESTCFAGYRKSPLQIYGVLANLHYTT